MARRFSVELSDVERGMYESFDLQAAQHILRGEGVVYVTAADVTLSTTPVQAAGPLPHSH